MQKLILKHKNYLKFIVIILLLGLLTGIIYYSLLNNEIKDNIAETLLNYNNYRYNGIIKDLIIMSLLLVTSLFVIGIPCSLFYLFYESLSIGFLISIFFASFKFSGLLYILIYILINRVLLLILMIIFVRKVINISRYIIGFFIYRKETQIGNKIILNFEKSIYIIIFVLIINIFLYFFSSSIFSNLAFLLK